jgi:hypothetical protein
MSPKTLREAGISPLSSEWFFLALLSFLQSCDWYFLSCKISLPFGVFIASWSIFVLPEHDLLSYRLCDLLSMDFPFLASMFFSNTTPLKSASRTRDCIGARISVLDTFRLLKLRHSRVSFIKEINRSR